VVKERGVCVQKSIYMIKHELCISYSLIVSSLLYENINLLFFKIIILNNLGSQVCNLQEGRRHDGSMERDYPKQLSEMNLKSSA
jgi:hypothetical protein